MAPSWRCSHLASSGHASAQSLLGRCSVLACEVLAVSTLLGVPRVGRCFLLEFGDRSRSLTVFRAFGLFHSLSSPIPLKNYRHVEPHMRRLRLHSDFIRGVLFLWTHSCPAILLYGHVCCPGIQALARLAPFAASLSDVHALGNCPCADCFSCFILN